MAVAVSSTPAAAKLKLPEAVAESSTLRDCLCDIQFRRCSRVSVHAGWRRKHSLTVLAILSDLNLAIRYIELVLFGSAFAALAIAVELTSQR